MDEKLRAISSAENFATEPINKQIAAGSYGKTFDGYRKFVEHNRAFHDQIVALADNSYFAEAYRQLGFHEQTFRLNAGRGVPDLAANVGEHAAIIAAMRSKDWHAAGEALARHIRGGYQRLARTKLPRPPAPETLAASRTR